MAIVIPWRTVTDIVKRDAPSLTGFHNIVGLTRGGVVLASLIHRFHPLSSLHIHDPNCVLCVGDDNTLVVDDIWDTGFTLRQVWNNKFMREGNLTMYTLVTKTQETMPTHKWGIYVPSTEWVKFPWEVEE